MDEAEKRKIINKLKSKERLEKLRGALTGEKQSSEKVLRVFSSLLRKQEEDSPPRPNKPSSGKNL